MLRNVLFLLMITLALPAYAVNPAASVSPWEHAGSEITTPPTIVPGSSPLTYSTAFTREREMYGYNPRFMPTLVTFDKNNRPYMLTSVHPTNSPITHRSVCDPSFTAETAYLQTIDSDNNWITYDIGEIFWDLYQNSSYIDPQILTGFNYNDRVVFGEKNLYFTFYESVSFSGKTVIYSRDGLKTVEKVGLASNYLATLEAFDSFTSSERRLPAVTNYKGGSGTISLAELEEDAFGNIAFTSSVDVSPADGRVGPMHTGYLNYSVTIGDIVHCFWLDGDSQTIADHTDQYYSNYDRSTGLVSTPYLLGSTIGTWYGDPPSVNADPHNGPTVTVDRNKTLHVVLGGHGSSAKYTYSEDKGRTWSTPVDLPGGNAYNTYPTIITDRDNTLHLVYRNSGEGSKYTLAYSRKKEGENWVDMGALVMPGRDGYNLYHQDLTVDRLGRLFLCYWYKARNLNAVDIAEYEAKWPSEPSPADDDENSKAHDPAIIMTDDGGNTWRIATTQDFVDGIIDDTVPVAYYKLAEAGEQEDCTGNGHDLTTVNGGPTVGSGQIGNAMIFDGIDDGVVGVYDQNDLGAFTLAGWFKVDTVPTALTYLVNAKGSGSEGFGLFIENQKFSAHTYAGGFDGSVTSPISVTANQWMHVAFTYAPDGDADGTGTYTGTSKLYVDGQLKATATGQKYLRTDGNLAIAQSAAGGSYSACSVDDVAIFSGAMPIQKISDLASEKYSPFNVSRELLYDGDINEDGIVDWDDLEKVINNWLVTP